MAKKKNPQQHFPFNKSRLRSAIRREWMYCKLKQAALARARVSRGVYRCEKCSDTVSNKDIEIDHIVKVTPLHGLETGEDWGILIKNMFFCGLDGLVALCSKCHDEKSQQEKEIVKKYKKAVKEGKAT